MTESWLFLLFVFLLGLCWGSFLYAIAHRLLEKNLLNDTDSKSHNLYKKNLRFFLENFWLTSRSRCPHCKHVLAWYDLIPIVSYLLLGGSCRYCSQRISSIYPIAEFATGLIFILVWMRVPIIFMTAYIALISSLFITIYTDIKSFIIFRSVTWSTALMGIIFSTCGVLPISFSQSIMGLITGYLILWLIKKTYLLVTGRDGIGDGDLDLLASIGAYTGYIGAITSFVLANFLALFFSLIYVCVTNKTKQLEKLRLLKIPFGPFLALGALLFLFAQEFLMHIFFYFVCPN